MAIQLRSSLIGSGTSQDDVDPMSSIANLADVMLVFACGLMIAVVLAWDVAPSITATEVTEESKLSEVEDIEQMEDELSALAGDSYVDMGRVYMDPSTGKYYMVVEDEAAAAGVTGDTSASSDQSQSENTDGSGQ